MERAGVSFSRCPGPRLRGGRLPYYMLFKHSPGSALDAPYGIHVRREGVNALCVFSSDEATVKAREKAAKEYPPVREYYFEASPPTMSSLRRPSTVLM